MSHATPTYTFGSFLASLPGDWYDDDLLLHRLLDRYAPDADRGRIARFGPRVAGPLSALAEMSALPDNAPRLTHRDAHDHRLDEIVLPASTAEALHIAHGDEGLGTVRGDPFTHYAMIYLLAQNGEAGVACSLACTDGLVRALDAAAEDGGGGEGLERARSPGPGWRGSPRQAAIDEVRESSPDGYAHGAQFVTEIQGGSDVPANRVRATPEPGDPGSFRIHGQKWFCSNINADWFLVTARSDAAEESGAVGPVGLFLVPAFIGGHRNGYTVDRLKDKLGTRELATAEMTFDGARAWTVGPPDGGLGHLLRYVLTPSRYACILFAAGALRRAERITDAYAEFREAFGRPIARYPLVSRTLDAIGDARRTALVTAFELLRLWQAAAASGPRSREAVDFRILLSLAKPVLTRLATEQLHEAMMLLGGNGIEERFSPLPRLYRDSVIMETWEGPHNVLFTQALRDLRRFDVEPGPWLARVSGESRPELAERLSTALARGAGVDADGDADADGGGGGDGNRSRKDGVDGTVILADLAPGIIEAVAAGSAPGG